jgi:hypothetical protein
MKGNVMQQVLVTVRYRVHGDRIQFRNDMAKAAAMIAGSHGLAWEIWGFHKDRGAGINAYLFESAAAATAFVAGPVLERLRARPDVTEVSYDLAPIDQELSAITGAGVALASAPAAAAS